MMSRCVTVFTMTTMSEDPKEDLINYLVSIKKSDIETHRPVASHGGS